MENYEENAVVEESKENEVEISYIDGGEVIEKLLKAYAMTEDAITKCEEIDVLLKDIMSCFPVRSISSNPLYSSINGLGALKTAIRVQITNIIADPSFPIERITLRD